MQSTSMQNINWDAGKNISKLIHIHWVHIFYNTWMEKTSQNLKNLTIFLLIHFHPFYYLLNQWQ